MQLCIVDVRVRVGDGRQLIGGISFVVDSLFAYLAVSEPPPAHLQETF